MINNNVFNYGINYRKNTERMHNHHYVIKQYHKKNILLVYKSSLI